MESADKLLGWEDQIQHRQRNKAAEEAVSNVLKDVALPLGITLEAL